MGRITIKNLKYFIPSFLLMIIIFLFSSQNGEQSSGVSSHFVLFFESLLHITIPEFFIRKAAHMSEYALLTMTFIYGFYKSGFEFKRAYLISILCCFLYACTDEMHQLFIGGRAGTFTDVLIDTSGGVLAVVFVYILFQCILKRSN